jgi:hypothetical protein
VSTSEFLIGCPSNCVIQYLHASIVLQLSVNSSARHSPATMQIFVKTPSNKTITLEVEPSHTIEDITKMLEDDIQRKGYTTDTIHLIFAGKNVSDRSRRVAKVGRSIPPIHPLRNFLIRCDPVVVDGSSRSEGRVRQVNLYVLACYEHSMLPIHTFD